jgi:hypothetical protein
MDSDEKVLNVDKIGYLYKAEDNDKRFRIKGTLINDTIQTYIRYLSLHLVMKFNLIGTEEGSSCP